MELSALAGNERLKELLTHQQAGRGLSHAYIISGATGSGRHTLARLLCAAMVCTAPVEKRPCGQCNPCKKVFAGIHPDVSVISAPGEGKAITVDQIRALRSDAHVLPNEGERKVYVLERADQMNAGAQNAMLKLLEEGPPYAAFLLLAENGGALLQTVRSRCEALALLPVTMEQGRQWLSRRYPDKEQQLLDMALYSAQGILGRVVEQLEGDSTDVNQRHGQCSKLAQLLETGDELELFEEAMVLDKSPREQLPVLLDELERCIGERMVRGGDRRRLYRGLELVKKLRSAARLNANAGQISGWLCAGMFISDTPKENSAW